MSKLFFGKINVIMTLRGGVVTPTFLFVYCFLFVNYYSKILLQLCQLYRTGHLIVELTLYQMLESDNDTSLSLTSRPQWQIRGGGGGGGGGGCPGGPDPPFL